jgi:hypothetical protein
MTTLRLFIWIYNRKLDALLAESDTFSARSRASETDKYIARRKSKSFAEISEAMHRHMD